MDVPSSPHLPSHVPGHVSEHLLCLVFHIRLDKDEHQVDILMTSRIFMMIITL